MILLTTINIPNTAMAIVHAGVAATTVDEASTADVDPPLLSQPDTLQQQEEEEEGEVKDAAAGSNRGMSGAGEPPAKAGEEEEADAVLLESAKVLPEEILEHGNNLLQEGKSKEAVEVLTEAVKQFQEFDSAESAQALLCLGVALGAEGDHFKAHDIFDRAYNVNVKVFGVESRQVAECMHGMGLAQVGEGHAAAGAESLTRALRSRSQRLREDHDTQRLLHNLRDLVRALGEVEGSERDGDGDGQGMVSALLAVEEINLLGWRYFIVQDVSQGQTVLQQALRALLEEPHPDSPMNVLAISAYLFNLGFFKLAVLGDYQSSADVLKQAYTLRTPMLGETHELSVQVVVSRGWALTLTGQTELAVDELTSCAEMLLAAGQAPAAERLLRQAMEMAEAPLGVNTYAHVCYTQHINFLKYHPEAQNDATEFSAKQTAISREAILVRKHRGVQKARVLLAQALTEQIEEESAGRGSSRKSLLRLSIADVAQLWEEIAALRK